MESITYHRGSSETTLKNSTEGSIIYRNCTYQHGSLYNRAGMCSFFFRLAVAIRCCPMPKCNQKMKSRFPIQHILNSKSNISNTTNSQFKFQVSTCRYKHGSWNNRVCISLQFSKINYLWLIIAVFA